MDDNIGLVLAKLEAMGQLDNTIVVFSTDNGSRDHALTSTCSAIASCIMDRRLVAQNGLMLPGGAHAGAFESLENTAKADVHVCPAWV